MLVDKLDHIIIIQDIKIFFKCNDVINLQGMRVDRFNAHDDDAINFLEQSAMKCNGYRIFTLDGVVDEIVRYLTEKEKKSVVTKYDKDHIWFEGQQYISIKRFAEVYKELVNEIRSLKAIIYPFDVRLKPLGEDVVSLPKLEFDINNKLQYGQK